MSVCAASEGCMSELGVCASEGCMSELVSVKM